jgi:hypothetical protein
LDVGTLLSSEQILCVVRLILHISKWHQVSLNIVSFNGNVGCWHLVIIWTNPVRCPVDSPFFSLLLKKIETRLTKISLRLAR